MKAKTHDSTRYFDGMVIENRTERIATGYQLVRFDFGGEEVVQEKYIRLFNEENNASLASQNAFHEASESRVQSPPKVESNHHYYSVILKEEHIQ